MRSVFSIRGLHILILLILSSHPDNLFAQDETAVTKQTWLFWQHHHSFTPRFKYFGDIGYRQELPYDKWIRTSFKPGAEWSAGNIVDLSGGMGFYYTVQEIIPNSFELRPWQGVKVHWPTLGRFSFDHYGRLEQRFNHSADPVEQWSSVLRGRYRLNVIFPINHSGIIDNTFFMRLNAEIYWNMGSSIEERFVNKNRYAMCLGYRFNLNWRLELYYMAEQSQAFSQEGFNVNSHIFQVSLKTYVFKDS